MSIIAALILFPLVASFIIFLTRNDNARNMIVRICAVITAVLTIFTVVLYFQDGISFNFPHTEVIDYIIAAIETAVAVYIITTGIKNRKYLVSCLSFIQTVLILWFEFTQNKDIAIHNAIVLDKLTVIMLLVIGIVGSLICIYAIGFMKWYHNHHENYKDRKSFFLSMLFLFLSAMFGLVLCNSLIWLYFC